MQIEAGARGLKLHDPVLYRNPKQSLDIHQTTMQSEAVLQDEEVTMGRV
jgi:hypothetical protein